MVSMTILKEKVERAIKLKRLLSKSRPTWRLTIVPTVRPDDAEKVLDRIQIEGSNEFRRLKEVLEGLSEEELQELQAIAFYGRSQ